MDFKKVKGNLVHKTAIVNWKLVSMGKNNIIGPYVVIGTEAQHTHGKSDGRIKIGIRSFNLLKIPILFS